MDLLATLRRSGGINALARQLGVPLALATAGVQTLLPVLLEEFGRYRDNMSGLLEILGALGGGALAADVMGVDQADGRRGAELLRRVAGGGEPGRGTADATSPIDVDPAILERMRPLLAMLIGGYVAARAAGGGANARELETIFDAPDADGPIDGGDEPS